MKPVRKCPDCDSLLQNFSARPPQGNELELDHCDGCGGVWGEEGRIQKAFGKAAEPLLRGGDTHRRCVLCRILLTPAVLPGGLSVDVCSACRGLYLDAGEFEKLGGRERSGAGSGLPKPPVAAQPPVPRPPPVPQPPPVPRPPPVAPPPPKAPAVVPVVTFSSPWKVQVSAPPSPAPVPAPAPAPVPAPVPAPAPAQAASEEASPAVKAKKKKKKAASAHPASSEPQEAPAEAANTFACIQCGKRVPFREGQAYRDGLACRPCMRALLGS
jgi:Zn-finger nucleic acid-binding protein